MAVTSVRTPLVDLAAVRRAGAMAFRLCAVLDERIGALQMDILADMRDMPREKLEPGWIFVEVGGGGCPEAALREDLHTRGFQRLRRAPSVQESRRGADAVNGGRSRGRAPGRCG